MDWILQLLLPSKTQPLTSALPSHPFYPLGLEIPNYVANQGEMPTLLVKFFGGCAALSLATWFWTTRYTTQLHTIDKSILIWFVLSGTIHLFFEGYFAYNHSHLASAQDLFGQLWKEYALSDSRYMISDDFMVCVETITAVCWGPLAYLTAVLILKSHPLRYPMQGIVSVGHIYSDILYFATNFWDLYDKGLSYCRPEGYYLYFYFVFLNIIWIVVPSLLLYQSMSKTAAAFRALDQIGRMYASNGTARAAKSVSSSGRAR